MIKELKDINTKTDEGKYLMAALAKITTESQTDKTPCEVLEQLGEKVPFMYDWGDPKQPTLWERVKGWFR